MMKKCMLAALLFTWSVHLLYGQMGGTPPEIGSVQRDIPTVHVNELVSTHFIFPEPIQYVDLSSENVVGDLPVENVLRVKPLQGSGDSTSYLGVLTIVGQKLMMQYHVRYVAAAKADKNITISSGEGISLITPEITLSEPEMKDFCIKVLSQKPSVHGVKSKENRLEVRLNNVFTIGNYFFIDITARNKTHIPYSVDQLRFKIEDKKIPKATNAQAVEITPVYALYDTKSFKSRYRNIFVFEKFTFPNEKVFSIALAEKQISGRQVVLRISYRDMLNADSL